MRLFRIQACGVLARVLACVLLGLSGGGQAWAQTLPLTVDTGAAGVRPVVGNQGGVPVIQIAPPAAGVSNNKFTEFNVGPSGVILNNSGAASQTQLAGQIAGNPHLGRGPATTILNQVTAPNPSQLRGLLEVAGQRANVIVANPAGIACDGCGFVNASRATLTTGRPLVGLEAGAPGSVAFEVTEGLLQINGQGLNVSNISNVDLLARAIQINAQVWADHLNVVAGAARVDGVTGEVTAIQGKGPAPRVSLDTAALGGMYANSIRLIGTERGLGVNMGGALQALTGDLVITNEGEVHIAPQGSIKAHGEVYVQAPRLETRGRVEGQHVSVRAQSLLNEGGTIQAAGDIDISVAWMHNLNANFASENVELSSTPKVYYTPSGSTDMYDAATTWLCDAVTPACGKHPSWLNDDPERRLLLPSAQYPEAQYGPPFDYVPQQRGHAGITSPIALSLTPSQRTCQGPGGDAGCNWVTTPDQFHYEPHGRIWTAFGVAPPQGPQPVWHESKARRGRQSDDRPRVTTKPHNQPTPERRAYEAAINTYKGPYGELDSRIRAFNQNFKDRLVQDFTYYEVHDKVSETRTRHSQPGRILAGGAIALRGEVTNDKSHIVATGPLTIAGPALRNHGAGGERRVTREGQATFTQARHGDRKAHRSPYHVTLSSEPISLPVGPSNVFPQGALRDQHEYTTLISGRDTFIAVEGELHNSGMIAPREAMVARAANILNQEGGRIQGRIVDLQAREKLRNVASQIKGDIVSLRAGQDIELSSVVASESLGATSGTHMAGVSQVQADDLLIAAGRDLKLVAAQVSAEHDAHLRAGRDMRLDTVTERHREAIVGDAHNRHERQTTRAVGSTVAAGGDLTMMAQQDLSADAAQIDAQQHLAVGAGRDVSVGAGKSTGSARDQSRTKTKGLLSSKTTDTVKAVAWERAEASTLTGETVEVVAGRDLKVVGSNLVGEQDIQITVEGDLHVAGADEHYETYQYERTRKKGIGSGGGFSAGYQKQVRTDKFQTDSTGYAASTLGSVEGNLNLDAAGDIYMQASNLLAQHGDITVQGRNVEIVAGMGHAHQAEHHEFEQSGLSIGVAGGVLGAAQQIQHTIREASGAQSGRLAAVKAGQAAYEAVQAGRMMAAQDANTQSGADGQAGTDAQAAKKGQTQAQIQISAGSTRASSTTKRTQETAFGSSVIAGGDVNIVADGERGAQGKLTAADSPIAASSAAGGNVKGARDRATDVAKGEAARAGGHITVAGSDIAGKNVLLSAMDDLTLQGVTQTSTEITKNHNSGWKAGVGVGVSEGGGGINVFASGYQGGGRGEGNGVERRETQISAQDNVVMLSGRDTVLAGAQVRADHIEVSARRNLEIVSQQDSDRYDARQQQVNAGGSFSVGSMTGTANLGANRGKTRSRYDSVNEQTGLYAGEGGFDIEVGAHTQLDGAVIASRAAPDKNYLATETLGFTDIENKAAYRASSTGMSVGVAGVFDILENQGSIVGGPPGGLSLAAARGTASGTTQAAIAPATIEVRADNASGRDSAAGLNRHADNANGRIDRIFDQNQVREQLEFQQAFAQLGMQIAGDVAAQLQKDNPELWAEKGAGRIALHAAVAGLGAALGAGDVGGAVAGTIAGDITANLVRDQVEQAVQSLPAGSKETVAKVIVNVVASTAGGLVGGTSGAGGAAAADRFNRQLHPDEGELIRKHVDRYAKRQDISIEQAKAELTGQAQRQTDDRAAEYYAENPTARGFLAEIATELQGSGFAYFDGQIDQSNKNELQFAGFLHDNDNLAEFYDAVNLGDLYDTAWEHLRASKQSLSSLTGVTRAQAEAADTLDYYATNPGDLAKVREALRAERDHALAEGKAWAERDGAIAREYERTAHILDEKLETIKTKQNGGVYELKDLSPEDRIALGAAMPSMEGKAGRVSSPPTPGGGKAAGAAKTKQGPAGYVSGGNGRELSTLTRTGEHWRVPQSVVDRFPKEWEVGLNKKGVGYRWQDPKNQGNGVRIDKGNSEVSQPIQQVDHVIVRSNGRVIGRDGKPIEGSIKDSPEQAHIPLSEYQKWKTWNSPD